MYTHINFNLLIKHVLLFIFMYMFMNSIKLQPDKFMPIIIFTTFVSIIFDIFMFDNIITVAFNTDDFVDIEKIEK
jgi:hypothetical protein